MKKIKVTKEGRENIYIPEKESLKAFIKGLSVEEIHIFIQSGDIFDILIGADLETKSVLEEIDEADNIAILTGERQKHNFGHALSIIKGDDLRMFDIGEITEKDLIIK